MKLSFQQSRFLLTGDRTHPFGQWKWDKARQGYTTAKLKEAARFQAHADTSAKRVFEKLVVRRYPLPPGAFHDIDRPGFAIKLMPFQRTKGVPFILTRSRSYLAHEPGLGKTVQFITAVSAKPKKALIICPSFLKTNWAREITKTFIFDFPMIQVVPESARRDDIDWGADFVICSDSMLEKSWVIDGIRGADFKFVGVDEIHRFKSVEAKRTVALFGGRKEGLLSPGLIYDADHVVGMSGTPMLNRPIELWTVLFAMAPETIDFMQYHEFGFKYCGPRQTERGHFEFLGSHNEAELNEKIVTGGFMQRITKADVLPELPDKVREVIFVDDERTMQSRALDDELKAELVKFEKPKTLGSWALLRHVNGVAKVPWAAAFISEILREDVTESVIVYAYHRDVVAQLAAALIRFRPMVIVGGVDEAKRVRIEDAFQSGRRRLVIGNISAMGIGLTLTKAKRVIFVEYSGTPTENEQAEDRAHRIGQHDSVFCQYLAIAGSIDEAYLEMILRKQTTIERVIDGKN